MLSARHFWYLLYVDRKNLLPFKNWTRENFEMFCEVSQLLIKGALTEIKEVVFKNSKSCDILLPPPPQWQVYLFHKVARMMPFFSGRIEQKLRKNSCSVSGFFISEWKNKDLKKCSVSYQSHINSLLNR